MRQNYDIRTFGAQSGGIIDCTAAIQTALDAAAEVAGRVTISKGTYLTGALFINSGVELFLDSGAALLGSTRKEAYPMLPSRVAGIEMEWPAGLLNVRDAIQVRICGKGVVNGQGDTWWQTYWEMREDYERRGLRWAVDYDCARPRNLVVWNSRDIEIEGITLIRSGFWNLHLCYSEHVTVRHMTIRDNDGPSTDGIDIDSCRNVLVENCRISCNDDNICIKAGRDADGLRVAQPCEHITIRDNTILQGEGITLGSETSGGIAHVRIENNRFEGTNNGFRLKSAPGRGGMIEDIIVDGMDLQHVVCVMNFEFDWCAPYSRCRIPDKYQGPVPEHWNILTQTVPSNKGTPHARNINIRNVRAQECVAAFYIHGLHSAPFERFCFHDIKISAERLGTIYALQDPIFSDMSFAFGDVAKGDE